MMQLSQQMHITNLPLELINIIFDHCSKFEIISLAFCHVKWIYCAIRDYLIHKICNTLHISQVSQLSQQSSMVNIDEMKCELEGMPMYVLIAKTYPYDRYTFKDFMAEQNISYLLGEIEYFRFIMMYGFGIKRNCDNRFFEKTDNNNYVINYHFSCIDITIAQNDMPSQIRLFNNNINSITWKNSEGQIHRIGKPAKIQVLNISRNNKYLKFTYRIDGRFNRENELPAIMIYNANGRIRTKYWLKTEIYENDDAEDRIEDYLDRRNGPACISYYYNGSIRFEQWLKFDKIHRSDGLPAITTYYKNGKISAHEWYENDTLIRKQKYPKISRVISTI